MKTKFARLSGYVFLCLLFADVIALAAHQPTFHFWLKPLLMPVLLIFFYYNTPIHPAKNAWYIFAGLSFAWAGDVFLLLENRIPNFFLFGLGSFLATHICYIFFFKKLASPNTNWYIKNAWLWLSILVYGVLLVIGLWPDLGEMKIPVIIYAGCISIMVILSMRTQPDLPKNIWVWLALGAFLFFISDSILAINKFHTASQFGPPLVMLTYGLAQYFIILGCIRFFRAIANANQAPAG
jgi:uncharacterized membrane protein YhhN